MKTLPTLLAFAALATAAPAFAGQGPTASPDAPVNPALKSPSDMAHAPLAKGRNSFTKDEAQVRLGKAGFGAVTGLALDQDGLWQAQATWNGQPVHVALDYKGDIATTQ